VARIAPVIPVVPVREKGVVLGVSRAVDMGVA